MGRLVSRKPIEINLNSPLNGYLPIFDGDTKLWETISSSSLFDSGGLFSGSAQVLITGTTGYDNLTSSIDLLSSSFLELSASYQSNFESASFTGSYKGDGSGLYNIPFSGVTGLVQYSSSVSLQLDALEDESGSIRSDFNSFTSSYTTGSFTGSFIGDASGLTNLNKIYDGNVSASISQANGFRVNTDVYIDGTITAKEIHTDYVTSSVLFQSGSTKFGNSNDDTHQFTGSISLASEATNFNIVGNSFGQTYLQSLNGAMVLQPGYGGVEVIGANAALNVNGAIVGNTVSGSFTGNGAGLYNIPISGVTGLNTARIADGNATASISNTEGLRINTNTEITGSLIVSSGSATFDATLALTENSSLILNSGSNLYVYDGGIISGTFKGNGHLLTDLPYATTASNTFYGSQTVSGSVIITQDLTVLGSSSIVYVTSSQLNISTNIIKLNAANPGVRYGGLAVVDSGSNPQVSGSFLFDSQKDEFIFIHQSQGVVTSSVFLLGPETYGDLGNETYLTQNRIPKGSGIEHLNDSNITDNGTNVSINSNTEITGSLLTTGTIVSQTTPLVSGSSQILITGTTGYSAFSGSLSSSIGELSSSVASINLAQNNRLNSIEGVTGSYATTGSNQFKQSQTITGSLIVTGTVVSETTPLVSGSSQIQITGTTGYSTFSSSLSSSIGELSSSVASTNLGQNNRLDSIEGVTSSLNTFSSSINTTIKNKLNSDGVISGSSQVIYSGLTGIPSGIVSGSSQISNFGFATTGSNIFVGNQTVTGSLNVSGSSSLTGSLNVIGSSRITGDLTVQGNLIAQQFIVSSSITYLTTSFSSGSTKFGDTIDDTHQFTGSVNISGSQTLIGNLNVTIGGSTELQVNQTGVTIGNISTDTHKITGSLNISGSQTLNGILGVSIGGSTELQVNQTGVTIGNISTDIHKVTGSLNISGSEAITGSLFVSSSGVAASLIGSGSGVFTVDGTSGRLFQIDDSLSGSLFSVNTAAGLPVMAGFSDNTVRIGQFGKRALFVSQSMVGFGMETPIHKVDISGSLRVTNQIVIGSSQVVNQNTASLASGTQTISTNATSSYTSVFYNYTLASGSNARAGQVMAVWNGNSIAYTDNSTTDIGTTGNVALTASLSTGNVVLSTVLPTTGWTIKSFVNLL
jgi:hypothetical protein